MRIGRHLLLLGALTGFFLILSCAAKGKPGLLFREFETPPQAVQETLDREGRNDYFLSQDEGYSLRLIYLCRNRVYNFLEEPEKNLVLVSVQPILGRTVERRLSPEDRERIWACRLQKLRDEQDQVEKSRGRLKEEISALEVELQAVRAEQARTVSELETRKKIMAEQKRRAEEEIRRSEEDRRRRAEEDQRRRSEEERKVRAYRTGEKEEAPPPAPPPPPRASESGIFLALNPADIHEEPAENSRVRLKAKKYDIFEVINSREDQGTPWYQVALGERLLVEKGKRYGWSPEEKSFWEKHRLLVWVYTGDLLKIHTVKPLRMNLEEVQFTGKKASPPQKPSFYEVTYEVKANVTEKVFGWVNGKGGVRRSNRNGEEMRALLEAVSNKEWSPQVQTEILGGYIAIGFNPEQVELSWGKPDHVNKTRTLVGVHEQWVYGANPFPRAFVYFENGLVKKWEFLKKQGG